MPQSCVAYNCYIRHRKGGNLKFHTFPKTGLLRDKWIAALGRADFVPSTYSRICSKHFHENDYEINAHGKKVLKKDAIPSKFCFVNSIARSSDANV
ncbi:THAP domain-containing protein 1-like [Coccinella septempunctata]|uniref:THAP domain-containing protein 1-like n=1 Tax=Coccinella septempunctata TaxID=41139 RepID=UPI001D07B84C|nr:THAP domain-containing protein 1-like [Coccinella septempunctata]